MISPSNRLHSEITFMVEPQGTGWLAQCVEHSIVTEADSLDLLQPQIQDAVRCHFDAGLPDAISLKFVLAKCAYRVTENDLNER